MPDRLGNRGPFYGKSEDVAECFFVSISPDESFCADSSVSWIPFVFYTRPLPDIIEITIYRYFQVVNPDTTFGGVYDVP